MGRLFSPISRYYLYRVFVAEGFVYPIITLYALAQGISLSVIGLATGSYFLGTLLGEVPTGYLGDRIGRRNSLVVGAGLLSVTHVGFALADTAVAYVGLYAFWGVAATFRSGSGDAWLYDTLAATNATESYTTHRGRASSVFFAAAATTALIGGLLYEWSHSLPFVAAAGTTAFAALVGTTLPPTETVHQRDAFSMAEATAALSTLVSNRRLGTFVGLSAIVLAVPETIEIFVQPTMEAMGVRPGLFGPLYAVLMGTAAIGASQAERLRRTMGISRWYTVGPVVLAVALVVAVVVPPIAVPVFVLARGHKTATETLASTFCNEQIAAGRATVLSGVSMVYALVFFGARSMSGLLAAHTSPTNALAMYGCLAVTAVLLIRTWQNPFESQSTGNTDTKNTTSIVKESSE